MENICCVCLEETKKVTNCNHFLCCECYSKMYGKKCPICRRRIIKSSYRKIKKINRETENVEQSAENNEISNRSVSNQFELMARLSNNSIFLQEIQNAMMNAIANLPPNSYIDLNNTIARITVTLTQTQPVD